MFFLSPKLQFDVDLVYNFMDFLKLRNLIRCPSILIYRSTQCHLDDNMIENFKGILIFGDSHLNLLLSIVFLSQGAFNNHPELFQQLLAIMEMILTTEPIGQIHNSSHL